MYKDIEEIVKQACNREGITKRCPQRIAKALINTGYGDVKQAQIDILNKLKQIIHEDDFESLCFDGAASEADVFNYIDNLIEEIKEEG